jgi:segregation and condensation protein A
MQDRIFQMLLEEDEITWQTILYDLVRKEDMNPWDINVSVLTQRYIEMIRQLKETDFRISGKVLLAAAILLRIKCNRLVGDDLLELDRLIYSDDIDEDQFYEELESEMQPRSQLDAPPLIPRTPQPRKRKVSIYDLIGALEQALEVKRRRVMRSIPPMQVELPKKQTDISQVIKQVYNKILSFLSKGHELVTFTQLIPSQSKEDKVYTFIPLLHLSNQHRVDLSQKEHFGEIEVMINKSMAKKEIDQELDEVTG